MTSLRGIGVRTGGSGELPWWCSELGSVLGVAVDELGSGDHSDRPTVLLDCDPADLGDLPSSGNPLLVYLTGGSARPGPFVVSFTDSVHVDRRLRSAEFPIEAAGFVPVPAAPGDEVMALADEERVWVRREVGGRVVDITGMLPTADPAGGGAPGRAEYERIVGMIPFIHFARRVSGYEEQQPTPLRACFLIDDPNLRLPTYGHLRFREVADHSRVHGYHVSIAMIPLDAALYGRSTVRLFRSDADRLSLSIHGNNHTRREFAAGGDLAQRRVAQALRRIARFERRTGLAVDRVAIPPHGGISRETLDAAALVGFHGIAASPWAVVEAFPGVRNALGLGPASTGPRGIPILVRRHLMREEGWFSLHAFLDQPVIAYAHHDDLAGGLTETLGAAALRLERIGPVRWCGLREMVESSFITRVRDGVAHIRPFADHLTVRVPDDAHSIAVAYGGPNPPDSALVRSEAGIARIGPGEVMEASPGAILHVELERAHIDPGAVPSPRWSPWPVARRVLTEGRDRLRPILRR
jgi:hypothetical protein